MRAALAEDLDLIAQLVALPPDELQRVSGADFLSREEKRSLLGLS
jgi:hypothetical protein